MFDYANIDRIFVKLFKKTNDFEICTEHLKRSRQLNTRSLNIWIHKTSRIKKIGTIQADVTNELSRILQ